MKGKSNESPLYVATTVGLASLKWLKNLSRTPSSSASLKMMKGPSYFVLGGIFEVFNVLGDDLAVGDEETLTVDHVGDHHNGVGFGVGEFERLLGGLDVECHDRGSARLTRSETILRLTTPSSKLSRTRDDTNVLIDGDTEVVRDVVFSDVDEALRRVESACCCSLSSTCPPVIACQI